MLKLDLQAKRLTSLPNTTLSESNILERADLQEAILCSWADFCSEMGFEELFLIGSEVVPHHSCRNRIDILALSRDGSPIIFELKRHRDKLQLLQALAYAAMVAKWDTGRVLKELGTKNDEESEELRTLLASDSFQLDKPQVVLIAEGFDPEVILAADWLADFGVPISAFGITGTRYEQDTLLSIDQRFPLLAVDDVYDARRKPISEDPAGTWHEALSKVTYPFAEEAVAIFQKYNPGNPGMRQFHSIYSGSALGRMRICFKLNYLKIYTTDQSEAAEQVVRSSLEPDIEVSPWGSEKTKNSGFTFVIKTDAQFRKFLAAVGES